MAPFPNGAVANAESVIYISDLVDQVKRLWDALSRQKQIQLKDTYQSIQSDVQGVAQSIESLAKRAGIGGPEFCARCLHILTATPEQLAAHIETAAKRMSRLSGSWPAEDFKVQMARELEPGDEIVMLGIGRVSVRRKAGNVVMIYQGEK
jgi:hypothetical protein